MGAKRDRHIVVDACIAMSAGESEGISVDCAKALRAILESDLTVKVCPYLGAEWRKHAKRLALEWYSVMKRKQRVDEEEIPRCNDLHKAIDTYYEVSFRPELKKDAHLVEAAWDKGRKIISQDRKIRDALIVVCQEWSPLKDFHWAHLSHADAEGNNRVLEWLRNSAPDDPRMTLVPEE